MEYPQNFYRFKIEDENDLMEVIHFLYPYYGFENGEEFRYFNKEVAPDRVTYALTQYINGIRTNDIYEIGVDDTGLITRLGGSVAINTGVTSTPAQTEAEARQIVLQHIASTYDGKYNTTIVNAAELIYGSWGPDAHYEPMWYIPMDKLGLAGINNTRDFYVHPDDSVRGPSTIYNGDQIEVCDGPSNTSVDYYTDCPSFTTALVIDSSGTCQSARL